MPPPVPEAPHVPGILPKAPNSLYHPRPYAPLPPPLDLSWWGQPTLRKLRGWVWWAGRAGKGGSHHPRFSTYHEPCARAGLNHADHAAERALPRAPGEAILDDVFQGLPPPRTLETIRESKRGPPAPPSGRHHQGHCEKGACCE